MKTPSDMNRPLGFRSHEHRRYMVFMKKHGNNHLACVPSYGSFYGDDDDLIDWLYRVNSRGCVRLNHRDHWVSMSKTHTLD